MGNETFPVPETDQESPSFSDRINFQSIPNSCRILLALVILAGLAYALRLWVTPIRSWDFWFHIKAGEWIFQNHRMPPGDIFSEGYQGKTWIVNAWLSDVFLWAVYNLTHSAGIIVTQTLLILGVSVLIAFTAYRISRRITLSLLVTLLAIFISYLRVNSRPELFTLALLVVMVVILFRYKLGQSDRILWLIPLGALWANLHMGFVVAVAVLGCFLLGDGIVAFWCSWKKRAIPDGIIAGTRLRRLALVSVGMIAATLINPYFHQAWLFTPMVSGSFRGLVEWQSLVQSARFYEPIQLICLAFLAVLVVGSLALSRRSQDLTGFLLAGVFAIMAIRFNRQSAQFALVAPLVIAHAARGARWPGFLSTWAGKMLPAERFRLGLIGLLGLEILAWALLGVFHLPKQAADAPFGFGIDPTRFSSGAIQFVRENGLAGKKIYNSMEDGGWLIWSLWPEQKVSIDGRMDVYGTDAALEYGSTMFCPGISEKLKARGIEYCFIMFPPRRTPLEETAVSLWRSPDWALVYFDDSALIFVRRTPENTSLVHQQEYRFLSPMVLTMQFSSDLQANREAVLEEIGRIREQAPDASTGHLVAGMALLQLNEPQKALDYLREAQRYSSRWDFSWQASLSSCLGIASQQIGNLPDAVGHYYDALEALGDGKESRKQTAMVHNNLASVYLQAGKIQQAEEECRKALALHDGLAQTWICLAECYATRHETKSALDALEKAARLSPGSVAQAARDSQFDSLRGNPRFRALIGVR